MIDRPASTANPPHHLAASACATSELQIERQLAHDLLGNLVVANDICHVYFVNDTEIHALHKLPASMIEEQATPGPSNQQAFGEARNSASPSDDNGSVKSRSGATDILRIPQREKP
jgi:hypothetical protein